MPNWAGKRRIGFLVRVVEAEEEGAAAWGRVTGEGEEGGYGKRKLEEKRGRRRRKRLERSDCGDGGILIIILVRGEGRCRSVCVRIIVDCGCVEME